MKRVGAGLLRDQTGGVMVEASVMLVIIFVFVLGSVDFLMAMYQWNAAAKAVQIGARVAAVSNPVASAVTAITGLEGGDLPGTAPPPAFTTRTCSGSSGSCSGGGSYDSAAMNTIVLGRGSAACGGTLSVYCIGMQTIFPRVQPANVTVSYIYNGLGFAGRPGVIVGTGGPVPTITVELQGLNFQFFFLGGLMGFNNIAIPSMRTTVTGEDLSSSAPS